MNEIITIFLSVKPIHYLLPYFGMIIHGLTKYAEIKKDNKEYSLFEYLRDNLITNIIYIITIPILLILIADTTLRDITPITNATAILAGYQTQDFFKSLLHFYSRRKMIIK